MFCFGKITRYNEKGHTNIRKIHSNSWPFMAESALKGRPNLYLLIKKCYSPKTDHLVR
jgi:hypothetical protein